MGSVMGMDIRKTDTKGRITVGTKGEAYSQTVQPDGTIILKPLTPPKPPVMPEDAPHAVYVDYVPRGKMEADDNGGADTASGRASTITAHFPMDSEYAKSLALDLAKEAGFAPIVIDSTGARAAFADDVAARIDSIDAAMPANYPKHSLIRVRPADSDHQEFRDKIVEGFKGGFPKVYARDLLAGKTRILHFGDGINWLPPVSMHAFFGAAGIDADRVIDAEITDMPSDYHGAAKTGLLVTLLAKPRDEQFFKGVTIEDGEPSTFRVIIPLEPRPTNGNTPCDAEGSTAPQSAGPMHVPEERQPVELSEHTIAKLTDAVATKLETGIAEKGDAEKGDADNSAPSTEATNLIWDSNNACPWNCRFRHVHVARRSDSQSYWAPKPGQLRRTSLDAEATEEPPLPRDGANGGVPTTTLWFALHGSESAPEKALLHRAPGDSWGYNLSQDQLDEFVAGHLKGNAKVLFHIVARHIDAS